MHFRVRTTRFVYSCMRFCIPLSADEKLVLTATPACVDMQRITKGSTAILVCMHIDEPAVRALIHTLKYHGNPEAAQRIGTFVARHVAEICTRERIDYIVPVPLSAQRMRSRGFNQVLLALEAASRTEPALKKYIAPDIIVRTRDTTPQTTLSRGERAENMKGAFSTSHTLTKKRILLVDDVVTTGATLFAAKRALLDAGADSVILLTLAGR